MKQKSGVDVLICGAGAAGLMLAIELARREISFRLIEKAEHAFHGSRGKGIQPRTQEIFEAIGILAPIAAAGGVYPPERRYHNDGKYSDAEVMGHADPTPAEPYQRPLLVPQFLTEHVMREHLLAMGHTPEFGCELVDFTQDAQGVTAHLQGIAGDQQVRVRWLIGADGGRSFVRHALEVGYPGKTLGVRALVADVVIPELSRDFWHRFNDGDMARQISLCPLPGTEMFQLQGPIPLAGDVDFSAQGLTSLMAERTGRDDIHIQSVAWSSAYTMNARLADHYRVGQVFLVGDAAHIHPPTGGQGLNTSIQDAYNLGWKLAAVINGAHASLLESYEQERRPVAASMLGLATRLLEAQKQGDTRRGREVQQLDIGYPVSALSFGGALRNGLLCVGDRAPDAPVSAAGGGSTRLFSLFQGSHWTLLGNGTYCNPLPTRAGLNVHAVGPQGDLLDDQGHFHEAYRLAVGEWVLVRPDGYIAGFVTNENWPALERYLARLGLAASDC